MGFDEAAAWVRDHIDAGRMPGAVLGVVNREGTVAVETWGDAHLNDRYPLFSITKPLVGMVAARHVTAGRLSLDTPLSDAVPEFGAGRTVPVTLRHLVSHTSGVLDPELDDDSGLDASLLAQDVTFEAGTARHYSSIAFQGVARLIEHAEPRPWEQQLRELLAGAGATSVSLDAADTTHPPTMTDEIRLDFDAFAAERHPGAGASATLGDMLAIAQSLLRDDGRLVSPETLAMMREPLTVGIPDFDQTRDHEDGFTWKLRLREPGLKATDGFGHGGWAGTQLWMFPDHDLAYVFLTNVLGSADRGIDDTSLASALLD
ncbi:serine hydrolase domain-containing protein [Demequina sp.]|uniref:serine hydrolase domain-containing protein n=1 Tax=Demequina sp. TaxID=2050685 RepID=UPI003A84CCD6